MQVQTFNCPQCGGPIDFKGGTDKTIKCPFCDSSVIVPKELRATAVQPQIVMSTPPFEIDNKTVRRGLFGLAGFTLASFLVPAIFACIGLIVAGAAAYFAFGAASAPGEVASEIAPAVSTIAANSNGSGFANLVMTFGNEGTGPGLMEDARSVAIDGNGNIYVGEYLGGRIQQFDSSGKFVTQFLIDAKEALRGLAADRQGNLYVVQAGKIDRYQGASGNLLATLDYQDGPSFDDVAVTADGGLVTAWYDNRDDIVVFNKQGKVSRVIQAAISTASGDSELDTRVAADGQGFVYALGTFNDAVFKFSPDGKFVTRFGSDGDALGQFSAPEAIAVDGQSRVYVADFKGVQVFDSSGRYLGLIDVDGAASGMAFDSAGALYVVARTHVYKYEIKGQ